MGYNARNDEIHARSAIKSEIVSYITLFEFDLSQLIKVLFTMFQQCPPPQSKPGRWYATPTLFSYPATSQSKRSFWYILQGFGRQS
jgi:hypothetical protein